MATEVKLPRLGQGMESGTIVKWLKGEGEPVKKREPLYELDTDKVTQEVEAEAEGVLLKIVVPEGEADVGTTVGVIGSGIQARFQVQCLRVVREFSRVIAWSPTRARLEAYCHEMRAEGFDAVAAASAKEVCAAADILITAGTGAGSPTGDCGPSATQPRNQRSTKRIAGSSSRSGAKRLTSVRCERSNSQPVCECHQPPRTLRHRRRTPDRAHLVRWTWGSLPTRSRRSSPMLPARF